MIPAIMCGNTCVWKSPQDSPLLSFALARVMHESGLPNGVINLIHGKGSGAGQHLVNAVDKGLINKISFTGSTAVGKMIGEVCGRNLVSASLELGGKNPLVIMPSANLDNAVQGAYWAGFGTAGQRCTSLGNLIIHEDIYDDLSAAIAEYAKTVKVGDGSEQGTGVGPIQNKKQFDRVCELIKDAKDNGYEFLVGGDIDPSGTGYYVPISILDNPPEDARIVAEEQFGPVMPLMKFSTEEEVIERANNTEYGLGGAVWTNDPDKGVEIAEQLETGTVWVNGLGSPALAPFGGHKQSGFGVEKGIEGLKEFTYAQVITVKREAASA